MDSTRFSKILHLQLFDLIVIVAVAAVAGAAATSIGYQRVAIKTDERFLAEYYQKTEQALFSGTRWLGTVIQKYPNDLVSYQELIWETKPDVLLEMGTLRGGSAYYFASLFDLIGRGRVITVDIQKFPNLPVHPRITYLLGSSTSPDIVHQIRELIKPGERVMVSLDSDHHAPHVLRELEIYSRMVTPGQYLVVEDTTINGHPTLPGWGPGPAEAVSAFLTQNQNFAPDKSREKFLITSNPGGWLRRID